MPPETPTSRASAMDTGLDCAQLYALGLEHVRQLSRRRWTDHNAHDPGITILELLCYALTDLAYRAQFPLADLLSTPADNAANMARHFYTPRQVLPNRALTVADYRKLIIDVPGVKNAWIAAEPLRYFADTVAARLRHDDPGGPGIRPVAVRGLYRVRIEYREGLTKDSERTAVKDRVLAMLQENRNLCEDFVAVDEVETQDYSLCAELELEPGADPALVAAQVRFEVERYLAPPVCNYRLSEMRRKQHRDGSPYTVEEIFAGPPLRHGFIPDEELEDSALRTEIRLSDIIHAIMDIPGVRAVRDMVVNELNANSDGVLQPVEPANRWRLPVPDGRQPRLSEPHVRLVFYKRHLPVVANADQVQSRLQSLRKAVHAKLEEASEEDLSIPLGRYRDPAAYHSFQHHFPPVYGLSSAGSPADADDPRKVPALQLKAYLLFFDQVMADYFAQLSRVGELFSRDPARLRTYFAQVVRSLPGHELIYPEGFDDAQLMALLDDAEGDSEPARRRRDSALERRSRFLDHLLARFAEDFHHYVDIMRSAFGASLQSTIATKCEFLSDCPHLGSERGLAYNHALAEPGALWNSLHVSGLERRLARLLGIRDFSRRNLGTVSYETYTELDKTPGDEYRFRIRHAVSGKILLSSSTNYVTLEAARAEMEQAITLAQRPEGYERKTTADGRHYFNIIDGAGQVIARRIEYFGTAEALEAAIDVVLTHLREYYSGEGMYLIENILLRPPEGHDCFLPICAGSPGTDDDDPYSFRLHIVLPAYAGRFQNMDFRRFAEEVIRQETPAHILPKICWVDTEDMAQLERAYRDWLTLPAGAAHPRRQEKLEALLAALLKVRNVYPKRRLSGCESDDLNPPFVLGRTALGSEE